MTNSADNARTAHRTGFHSLRQGGLNWDSLPLRLFIKGNAKSWNPWDIDFSQDAADWQQLSEAERTSAGVLAAMFIAGEEAVTEDIQPFLRAMAAEGRIGDEMYLTQFAFEEAKHTAVFRLWLDAVGLTDDLHFYVTKNPGYRTILHELLPKALERLNHDPSPANQVRASVTYNHVVEGTLALTGYYTLNKLSTVRGVFPGMRELVRRIGDDERRHMAWGTFTCRRHVAAAEANWTVVEQTMTELLPHALGAVQFANEKYNAPEFGIDLDELVGYAASRAQRRLGAIESARGVPVAQIDLDYSPEQLEDDFGAEDAAAMAAAAESVRRVAD